MKYMMIGVAVANVLGCSSPAGKSRNSDISVHLVRTSAAELQITLRNPGTAAETIHNLHLGLRKDGGTRDYCCWAPLLPSDKALLAKQEYRFMVRPAGLDWCRDRDAQGSCIYRPLLDVATPGPYLAEVYQHKDSRDDPSSNSVPFEIVRDPAVGVGAAER